MPQSTTTTMMDEPVVSWSEYFDSLFNKVTMDSIKEYEAVYRYSEEERQDVYSAYTKTKGIHNSLSLSI